MNTIERVPRLFQECYQFREVLRNIVAQDFKIKYKRTFFGYFWSLLNPLLQLTVLTVIFSHVVRLQMRDYSLYLFSGFLAWSFFQNVVLTTATSLIENESFLKKTYLPKLIFPLSKICLRSVEFFFSLVALSILGVALGFQFHWTIVFIPAAFISLFLFTLGLSLVLSVANVYFRDIDYLLTVFMQLLYFATPIIYPASALPEKYRYWLMANPIVPQITLFQKLIYEGVLPTGSEWGLAYGTAVFFVLLGVYVLTALDEDIVFRL